MASPTAQPAGARDQRILRGALLFAAVMSSAFGFQYILGGRALWTSFLLHQMEGVLIFGCALLAPRLTGRVRTLCLAVTFVVATGLVVPAAYLAGEDQLQFLMVLPLLCALMMPQEPWVTVASGAACLSSALVLVIGLHASVQRPGYVVGTVIVSSASASYALFQLRAVQRQLGQQLERDMTRLTHALSEAAAALYSSRTEQSVLRAAEEVLRREGFPVTAIPSDAPAAEGAGADRGSPTEVPIRVGEEEVARLRFDGPLPTAQAAAIELFSRHLGAATENVRHHRQAQQQLIEVSQLQQELVSRERLAALGEAAAVVAHEVRNPLGAIVNAARLLTKFEPSAAPTLVPLIIEESMRLDRLVNDLLVLARPIHPRKRITNLQEVIERAASVASHIRGAAPVQLETRCPEPPLLDADPEYLQVAFANVIENALHVTPSDGRVRVWLTAAVSSYRITVEDQGPGISPELSERIFEPFFTTRPTGTGLGLAITKRMIAAHAGTIEVVPGASGARFDILLPRPAAIA